MCVVCVCVCVCVLRACEYLSACIAKCMHECACIQVRVCIYVDVYVCTCICASESNLCIINCLSLGYD